MAIRNSPAWQTRYNTKVAVVKIQESVMRHSPEFFLLRFQALLLGQAMKSLTSECRGWVKTRKTNSNKQGYFST